MERTKLGLSIFLTTQLTFALGFAIAYGVLLEACALPSALCLLPFLAANAPCFLTVCGDSWLQFQDAALIGAIVGLIPAMVVTLFALAFRRRGIWTAMGLGLGLITVGSLLFLSPAWVPASRLSGMALWFASGGLVILYHGMGSAERS